MPSHICSHIPFLGQLFKGGWAGQGPHLEVVTSKSRVVNYSPGVFKLASELLPLLKKLPQGSSFPKQLHSPDSGEAHGTPAWAGPQHPLAPSFMALDKPSEGLTVHLPCRTSLGPGARLPGSTTHSVALILSCIK